MRRAGPARLLTRAAKISLVERNVAPSSVEMATRGLNAVCRAVLAATDRRPEASGRNAGSGTP